MIIKVNAFRRTPAAVRLIFRLFCGALPLSPALAVEPEHPVAALIERIAPGRSGEFVLETIAAPSGENVAEVDCRDGKIVLRGDGHLSLAVALNHYLRDVAKVSVSWYADDEVRVPNNFPLPVEKIRKNTKLKSRFFLNYCTFGYSLPFWRWRDWERLIDWMALNGINMPLAQNGNEYIWQKVWRSYGLSDEEIRSYFTGPAHLPWHRMVNIDKWEGPLPQGYIDGQHELQKQILARERAFGMRPVLCAFSGHVPEALKRSFPNVKLELIAGWGGFPREMGCWFMNPQEPMFKEIQIKFLQEQQKEYGTSHYYGTDPFNEVTPPSWEPQYLASTAEAIYSGMAEVDPAAVWIQMAWTFQVDPTNWTNERLEAMIKAVPNGKMMLIDYSCEGAGLKPPMIDAELFRHTKNFFGAPFLWSYLGNFGGNTTIVGPVNKINERLTAVLNDPGLGNCVGVGGTLEGLNNPVVYEMLFSRVWSGPSMDVAEWMRSTAQARAGGSDAHYERAWDLLREKILVDKAVTCGGGDVVFMMPNTEFRQTCAIYYKNEDLFQVWKELLKVGPEARKTSAYERDLVDVSQRAMGNLGQTLRERMRLAIKKKDLPQFEKAATQFMELGRDLNEVLGTRSEYLLGKWLADARSWALTDAEKAYYERNARMIITRWGGHTLLREYANRSWNGLMRDYYLPRWQVLIEAMTQDLRGGTRLNPEKIGEVWAEHNWNFINHGAGSVLEKPKGDFFDISRQMYQKYEELALPN